MHLAPAHASSARLQAACYHLPLQETPGDALQPADSTVDNDFANPGDAVHGSHSVWCDVI